MIYIKKFQECNTKRNKLRMITISTLEDIHITSINNCKNEPPYGPAPR